MDDSVRTIEASVCALLRGETPAGFPPDDAEYTRRLERFSAYHGVAPLIARWFSRTASAGHGSSAGLEQASAMELAREHELRCVLGMLAGAGVPVLLLKGTALAYSIYPSPALRPRADTDLLIRGDDRQKVEDILLALGYARPNAVRGRLVSYQCGYVKRGRLGVDHVLDVHWRISNTQVFSGTATFDELEARAQPIPALGPHAHGLGTGDALMLACMHRVHHFHSPYGPNPDDDAGHERLIWLYDIHLLVERMARGELEAFVRSAEEKGVGAVCGDGLAQARRRFGSRIPEDLLSSLTSAGRVELSALHLRGGGARRLANELRALPDWPSRVRLLREHLLPPPEYMLEKYAVDSRAWLPLLYVRRAVHGSWRRARARVATARKVDCGGRD